MFGHARFWSSQKGRWLGGGKLKFVVLNDRPQPSPHPPLLPSPPPSTPFPFSTAIYSQFIDQTLCNRCGCESGIYFVDPYWPSFDPSSPSYYYLYPAFMIKVWTFRESLESMDWWLWVRHMFCWSILTQLWDFRVESLESMVRWINHMLVDPHWLTAFGIILHVNASSANNMKCTSFKIYPFDHFESLNMDFCSTYCCTGNSSLARVVHTLTSYRQHYRCNGVSHAWISLLESRNVSHNLSQTPFLLQY